MVWKESGNGRDPWDGGEQRPPDLDRLVSDVHKRLSSLFGKGRRGRRARTTGVLWLILLAVVIWTLSGAYEVEAGDRGVNLLLGRYTGNTTTGLHWHAPWPLGSYRIVHGVDTGSDYVRGFSALMTSDGSAITAEVVVHYRIVDLRRYLFGNAHPYDGPAAVDILGNLADSTVSDAVAHAELADLLGSGISGVEARAREELTATLARYDTGLEVTNLELRKLSMPSAVSASYSDVRQAESDSRKQSDEAQSYAADILPKAQGQADSRIAAAKAYAADVVQRAKGDVAAFDEVLAAYRRAPTVTRESLYLSTYEQILGQVDKVVVLGSKGQVTLSLERPTTSDSKATQVSPTPKPKNGGGKP